MASPQVEDGFTRIANELMDAILSADLTGREVLVLMSIVRKTYGYNKKEDDIAASQLGLMCAMSRPHVTESLNSLARKNIIHKRPGVHGSIIGVQKNHKKWVADPLKGVKRTPHGDLDGNHYTYRVTNEATGEFYIGVRTCKCLPAQDRYKGSGAWLDGVDKRKLKKEITGTFDTRTEAHAAEQEQIKNLIGNPLMKNVILFSTCTPSSDSVQGVQIKSEGCTESGQLGSTESEHTKDNVPKNNKQKKAPRDEVTFSQWKESCDAEGKPPIPEDDAVFAYADEVGLDIALVRLAWVEFKRKYTTGDGARKKYKNWNQHFQNAVRENWYGIWYEKDGGWHLTTRGKQIEAERRAKQND